MIQGYYRHPTIRGDRIVFVSEDDLWEVSTDGGRARRLTANPGPSSFPAYSPDGRRIAYTGRDEGVNEVHVMDADGGHPRRLTFHGALSQVVGWDGEDVIYASNAEWPFGNDSRLWAVPSDGGAPRLLPWGPARSIAFQPAGPGKVLGRHTADPARWKRYRGGRVGTLWIDRDGDGEFQPLVRLDGNLTSPMWIGSRIYFISDHEGHGNVYSVTPTGRSLRRHTHHEDFYARHASTDGRHIVYHCGADIWLLDPGSDDGPRRVDIELPSARPHRNRRFISPGRFLETVSIHPAGHSLAATVRGGSFTMGLWEGPVRRHGTVSDVRRRLTTWTADGESIVAVTDETGEDAIVVEAVDGSKRRLIEGDLGRIRSIDVAPAGDARVAVTNHRHQLLIVALDTGRIREVHRNPHSWIAGTAWSPDGRWLAFSAATSRTSHSIHLHDTSKPRSQPTRVTTPGFDDRWPSFDPGGRYLYFTSARVFDPVYDTHFHDYGFPTGTRPHLVTLRGDIPSPFDPAQRPLRAPGSPPPVPPRDNGPKKNDEEEADDSSPSPEPVEIDLEGIEDRVVAFPMPSGRYGPVLGAKSRAFVLSFPVRGALSESDGPTGRLEAWDFNTEKIEQITDGVSSIGVNADGSVLVVRAGRKVRVVPSSWKDDKSGNSEANRTTGWVDIGRIRAEVDPAREWRQMYSEAWRLQRDHFWYEDMSGVDWREVHDRYLPLVDRVGSRSEFSDLLWEMQGELGTSHAYELGGDYRPVPTYPQGLLGADLEQTRSGWRIGRIPRGDPWDPKATSPLAATGVDAREGDRLVAVDGVEVDTDSDPRSLLVDRGGRPVQLTLKRGRRRPHTVTITPLTDETALRYREWVEANRAAVAEATDGRAGYIHIPDMGPAGFAEFHRYLLSEVDKDGLVVDVRYNRGGNVSQLLLQRLMRRRLGWEVTRWRVPVPFPYDAPAGPMVCITNELAGSDGDIFSHTFKLAGLGPLIGTRTWGGVVGIWPQQSLVDGTVTTQPEFAHWFQDVGFSVENYGTDPDIEVHIAPQDYAAGRDPQLQRAIDELLELMARHEPQIPDLESRVSLAPPRLQTP
ncbi:MAG TPA: PDZ domain-containing protein [Acidimicrobiia bacterium]|nr:PDZ domain-containing protein [Acidimicrobiia bacterium]